MKEGMTIDEMAKELNIPYKTVHQRLLTAGIKPFSYKALYDPSALDIIRKVPPKGRPKKKPEKDQDT